MTDAQVWTIGQLLEWTTRFLTQKGIESARLDAQILLAHALQCKRIDLYGARHAEIASDEVRDTYRQLLRRRVEGCPVSYLVGNKEFFSLQFEITGDVLTPRAETEILVAAAVDIGRRHGNPTILDLGTGSGNIAISLAHQLPASRVLAVDISEAAIVVARRNAERHGLSDRIEFIQSDLLGNIPTDQFFDLIVSNPPYVATADLKGLPIEVRDYEPHIALDGGEDGLAIIDRILAEAARHQEPDSTLLVEFGYGQAEAIDQRLSRSAYKRHRFLRDGAGLPRVFHAVRRASDEMT